VLSSYIRLMQLPEHVDAYLVDGCGRCPLGGTPECKVLSWKEELSALRGLALSLPLVEEIKWGVPCYTWNDKNILMISAFKDYASVSFFKGALLTHGSRLLEKPGPNSYASRMLKFNSSQDILNHQETILDCMKEAIEIEKSGQMLAPRAETEPIPEELEQKFQEDIAFKNAFESLTPGRQRGYILYFSQPKQSKTRTVRIEKYTPQILRGEGIHDAYKKSRKK
jgi:uncharacterized protein YdeI (YjbR/CyaY-like superfamily)